jgi:hypothetical protein
MSDFYSAWLERSANNQKKVDEAPRVSRSKDLKWLRTRQDYKAALMIAPELGFPTGAAALCAQKSVAAHRQASSW